MTLWPSLRPSSMKRCDAESSSAGLDAAASSKIIRGGVRVQSRAGPSERAERAGQAAQFQRAHVQGDELAIHVHRDSRRRLDAELGCLQQADMGRAQVCAAEGTGQERQDAPEIDVVDVTEVEQAVVVARLRRQAEGAADAPADADGGHEDLTFPAAVVPLEAERIGGPLRQRASHGGEVDRRTAQAPDAVALVVDSALEAETDAVVEPPPVPGAEVDAPLSRRGNALDASFHLGGPAVHPGEVVPRSGGNDAEDVSFQVEGL